MFYGEDNKACRNRLIKVRQYKLSDNRNDVRGL